MVFKVGKCLSRSFKGVLRIFERSLKSVSGKFKLFFFKGVSKNFSRSLNFKSVSKSFEGISQKFQEYFKEDWRVLQGVVSGFHGQLKEFKREFQGSLEGISKMFQRSFKGIPRKFLWCLKKVSRVFQWSIMWISRVQRVFKVFDECIGSFQDV